MQRTRIKNILIPTDFSENSLNAITYAVSFYDNMSVNFYLLHVSLVEEINNEECFYKLSDTVLDEKIAYKPVEKLQEEIENLRQQSTSVDHNFYGIHEYIQFVEAIRKSVKENDIDMIVMGTRGASKISKSVLGSHTADVITRVKCAILVIPEQARYKAPENIVFPTDFNIFYKNKVLETLEETQKMKNSELNVLYVSKKAHELSSLQKKNRSYLQDFLEDKPHSFYFVTDKNIDSAIETFVENNEVDMIAMIAKNLNFFQRILFQPTVEIISYHTKVPFLVLHE